MHNAGQVQKATEQHIHYKTTASEASKDNIGSSRVHPHNKGRWATLREEAAKGGRGKGREAGHREQ